MARSTCRNVKCGKAIPPGSHKNRKYCSDRCRVQFSRDLNRGMSEGGKKTLPEHIQKIRALAFNNLEDEVREILRDDIRETVSQHVRDNVVLLAEKLSGMGEDVMNALQDDLKSRDEIVRSRAYALWMKYMMPLMKKDKDEDARAPVTVVFGGDFDGKVQVSSGDEIVQFPETEIEEEASADEPERLLIEAPQEEAGILGMDIVEEFEQDWPQCYYCKNRKHPDAIHYMSAGVDRGERAICSSCRIGIEYRKGRKNPMAIAEDPLFGIPAGEEE